MASATPNGCKAGEFEIMLKWLWLSAGVIGLDQLTKYWASQALHYHVPVPVMPSFNFTLMHNTGAAFSFLSDAAGWQRWFFAAVALGVSAALVVWLKRLPAGQRWLAVALALIIGGALGNLVDRLVFGYVIDFLDVYYGQWHWPAFNIADSAITVGAVILAVDALFEGRTRKAEGAS